MRNFLFLTSFLLASSSGFGQWTQQGADINGEAANNYAGSSVSLSNDGSRIAVGAYGNAVNGFSSGHARVFEFNGANWVQLGADIDSGGADEYFGWSLSLSGDGTRVAVGAPHPAAPGFGRTRLYEFDGVNWIQMGADIVGEFNNDQSGWSVSINNDGSRVAIGAPQNNGGGAVSGHVRVYEFNGVNWVQTGADINGEAPGDWSGYSVSINGDGNRVAIGAFSNDSVFGNDSGHARVYEFNGVSWVQLGGDIDSEGHNDEFGSSISLSDDGNRVAIGAPENDGNGASSGHVRVFEFDGVSWEQLGLDIDGEASGDESGRAVSISGNGNRLVVGARYNNGSNGGSSGHARVYEFDGLAEWVPINEDIDGEASYDLFGSSVSLNNDGSMVAVGAIYNDGNGGSSGHTRIFSNPNPTSGDDASVVVGTASGYNITTGNQNVFAGDYSGFNTTEGSNNTFTGYQSGFGNTTGDNNTFIGQGSGLNNQTGHNNTAIGRGALENNQFGRSNTAVGNNAGTFGDNFVNTTAIGSGAQTFASNQVRIGNASVVSIGGFTNWSNLSDGRFKKNIKEDIPGLDFITRLRPVSYEIDHSSLASFFGREAAGEASSSRRSTGFIAQEIAEILKAHGYEFSGVEHPQHEKDHYGIRYAEFVVPLVKGMQEQQQMIASLKEEIEILKKAINETNNGIPGNNDQTGKKDVNLHGFSLNQNIPNPFYQTTAISMLLPEHVQQARIVIYNLQGLELEHYELKDRGQVFVEISAGRFPSGMYLYALIADGEVIDVKKMILTK